MALDPNALFLQIDSVYNANSLGLMARDVIGEGVTTETGMAVTQRSAGATMSVDVAAGVAWVEGDEDVAQPCYRVANTSTTNVAIPSAHASLPRIDLVVLEVRDSQFAGGDDDARLRVVAGTPASTPTPPPLPGNAIALARVDVGAQVTEIIDDDITDLRQPWSPDKSRTGELVAMATAAPWGTLVCDGSSFDEARYPRLAEALGGTTLPDWRGRVLVGAGQGPGLSNRVLGQSLGVESVRLTAIQSGFPGGGVNNHVPLAVGDVPTGGDVQPTTAGFRVSALPGTGSWTTLPAKEAASAHTNMQPSHVATPCIRV